METKIHRLNAKDIMTREVLAVQADWPLRRLAEFLIEHGISGAPVVNSDGTLIGVVSLTDIVRHEDLPERDRPHREVPLFYQDLRDRYAEEELSGFRIDETGHTRVRDIMTPSLFRVDEDTPLREVAETMLRGKIHRVFVTHRRRMVGIITAMDLLKVVRDQ